MFQNPSTETVRKRLLIACPWGAADSPRTLSGFPYYLIPRLRESFDVHVSDRISSPVVYDLRSRALLKLQRSFSSLRPYNFPGSREVIARTFSKWLSDEVERIRPDAVLTFGCAPVAYYAGLAPVFLYIDALYLYKTHVYRWINQETLPKYELRSMRNVDVRGLENSALTMFTSRTITAESREIYPQYREKMVAVGIGSNLDEEIATNVMRPSPSDGLNLLFMSTNFERKGGRFALKVLSKLKSQLPSVTLHIVGDSPAQMTPPDAGEIVYHGWIDKSSHEERSRLTSLLGKIHISLLPTQGDLSPHSICEMNALGIPTIAHRIGGIPDLIEDGVTGRVLDQLDTEVWTKAVLDLIDDLPRYSGKAREMYEREQQWTTVAARIADEISQSLSRLQCANPGQE